MSWACWSASCGSTEFGSAGTVRTFTDAERSRDAMRPDVARSHEEMSMGRIRRTGESVRLFTDGACSGNPGPGGWAFILQHPASGKTIDSSGAEPETTNNRMELTGVIEGLASLKRPCQVELVTDSQYVAKGISEWLPNWKRQGWQRKERRSFQAGVERRPLAEDRLAAEHPPGSGDARSRASRAPRERGVRPHGGRGLQATHGERERRQHREVAAAIGVGSTDQHVDRRASPSA